MELLSPAGNLQKLKTAVLYGADAVYIGGHRYGMRASAENFSVDEIARGVAFAHERGALVYVVLNAFLHDDDFEGIDAYCRDLERAGVDAVIVSDLGVVRAVRQSSHLAVHLSTQSSCLNSGSGLVWRDLGVERLILGRESSLVDAGYIAEATGLEVELFGHGAMCMAYSGHCTISNFTAGRDSNRGGCIQSCRFSYTQKAHGAEDATTHFMSSKDLFGVRLVPEFLRHRIASLKIEGRMKSLLYVATTAKAYRMAIDAARSGSFAAALPGLLELLDAVPHRAYTEASLEQAAGADSIYSLNTPSMSLATGLFVGGVLAVSGSEMLLRLQRPVRRGDMLAVLPFAGKELCFPVEGLRSVDGHLLDAARQDTVVWLQRPSEAEHYNVVRTAGGLL